MSIRITLAAATIILLLGGSFYAYYKVSTYKMTALTEVNSKLSLAVQEQKQTIATINATYEQQTTSLTTLLAANASLSKEKEELSNKLIKHDLEELSRRKPGLVELRINNGTKELFDSFNSLSTK